MKLYVFIEANLDAIVDQWEAFARTLLPPEKTMSDFALRNHKREMLLAIVADMRTKQTEPARLDRSEQVELAPAAPIAASHGAMRHTLGFTVTQLVSEFRALRSNVLARWSRFDIDTDKAPAIEEIARFNEAIDRALGESLQRYSSEVVASRDLFLAVVGNDLRSRLQVIEMASFVLAIPSLSDPARLRTVARVRRVAKIMSQLITDLLEYTHRPGRGIPIERAACDLREACEEALDAARAGNPEQTFVQHVSGDLQITADAARLRQVLLSLLSNAVQHGDRSAPVSLSARGETDAIVLSIANSGKPIPPEALRGIFDPLVQTPSTTSALNTRPQSDLGLGLFIVREIVLSHQGTIDVQSSAETGTVFTIRLPRATRNENI